MGPNSATTGTPAAAAMCMGPGIHAKEQVGGAVDRDVLPQARDAAEIKPVEGTLLFDLPVQGRIAFGAGIDEACLVPRPAAPS